MIHQITDAIDAVNAGRDTPDAFYAKTKLVATSKWVKTDAWRGYTEIVPEPGYKELDASWVTGDWDDAPAGHSSSEVEAKTKELERKYKDIYIIFAPTSNVFSTSYSVIVRDPETPELKGKTVGHKAKLYTEGDNWRVRYHATDVVIYKDGKYYIDNGGWATRTTHKRMNEYLPRGAWVNGKNFETILHDSNGSNAINGLTEVKL